MATEVKNGGGVLPPHQAGVMVSRSGVAVTAYGQNPDGPGTLLRVWEQAGMTGALTITLPAGVPYTLAQPVNLRGETLGAPIPVRNGGFAYPLKGYAPASFVLHNKHAN
jgi:hypothetical protein